MAVDLLRTSIRSRPANPRVYYELAIALGFEERIRLRIRIGQQKPHIVCLLAIALDLSDDRAYRALADLYEYTLDAPMRAEEMLVQAMRHAPGALQWLPGLCEAMCFDTGTGGRRRIFQKANTRQHSGPP